MKRVLLLSAVAVTAAAGVTASHAASAGVPACPRHTPTHVWPGGASKRFVRPGANAMRLCRYYGLNSGDPRGLWQRRLILSGATIDHLTHTFNTLKEVQGTIYCEFDDGSEVLVIFAYPNGRTERVAVSLRGCRFATNGRSSRWTTAHLQHRLLNLVKRR